MNQSEFRPVRHLKMAIWTSVLWKMNIHMAKKWPDMFLKLSFISMLHFRSDYRICLPILFILGTINLRRRHNLGRGVKNLPNLPMDSSKKLPTGGVWGSKIVKICWRLKWMVPIVSYCWLFRQYMKSCFKQTFWKIAKWYLLILKVPNIYNLHTVSNW